MSSKLIFLKMFSINFFGLLATYLVSFFTPLAWWLVGIGFFVIADFITGIFAAKKRGDEIKSRKMFKSIPKLIAYGLGVIVAHFLSLLFFPDFPAVKLIAGFIAFIEIKSLDENIKVLTGHSLFGDFIKMLNPKRNEPEEKKDNKPKPNEK